MGTMWLERWIRSFARKAPGALLRCRLYQLGGVTMGTDVIVGRNVTLGDGVRIGRGTKLGTGAFLASGVQVGSDVCVKPGGHLGAGVTTGNGVTIGVGARLHSCVLEDHSMIESGVLFAGNGGSIGVGRHCYIGVRAVLDATGGIEIGDHVHIAGPAVGIWTHTSVYQCLQSDPLDDTRRRQVGPVRIEDNVWIGGNTIIYPGTVIGHHSVVLPGSVVARDVAPYSMVAGVPAKLKRRVEVSKDGVGFVEDGA